MGGEIIYQYNDASRGTFQYLNYAKQLVSFEGLIFKGRNNKYNVTPTDIDGLIQLDRENCFIIFELKHGFNVPVGQLTALAKLCDAITKGGSHCVVFVAVHDTECTQMIVAKDTIVKKVYFDGKWFWVHKKCTLESATHSFVNYIQKTGGQ